MKFVKFDNFTKFSLILINTKFFYRTLKLKNNFSRFPFKQIEIPFSDVHASKSSDSFWNLLRSVFYFKKTYQNFPLLKFHFFKKHYVFRLRISNKFFISAFIAFFKKFKKKNIKLFSRFYISKNLTNFSFFFRDSHFFPNLNSNLFDYYNWKSKLFFNFSFSPYFTLQISKPISIRYGVLNTDYKFFLLYYLFSFSNKKLLCVICFPLLLINACIIIGLNQY